MFLPWGLGHVNPKISVVMGDATMFTFTGWDSHIGGIGYHLSTEHSIITAFVSFLSEVKNLYFLLTCGNIKWTMIFKK